MAKLEKFTIYGLFALEVRDAYRRNETWFRDDMTVDVELLEDGRYMILTVKDRGNESDGD